MADDLQRMETVNTNAGDVEIGITDAIQQHFARHVVQRKPVSQRKLDFEHKRPRVLRECLAEGTGVFFYVFPGISAIASFTLAGANPATAGVVSAYGSLMEVGFAFALGIAFAIITCAPTSGGHFNPAITLCLAFWQGFPWRKVPHYILSQIIGSMMAGLVVMGMYREQILAFEAGLRAEGLPMVFNGGPASIFCSFPLATQTNLGYLFFIEFSVCFFIGIVIWSALDPANPFVSPQTAPFVVGLAYTAMIFGFADITISTNLARDLGCRIVAAIFYGGEAFSYANYSWISILVNIPATFMATGYYEFLMRDSLQRLGHGMAVHEDGDEGLRRVVTSRGIHRGGQPTAEAGYTSQVAGGSKEGSDY